uniref:SCO-spondin-like n=1 Tax=Saccoglossus kowalevskii TaxID=10224 RepID=A0ABM0MWP7_SACKO|nr:PREDICTED: SCO-spondin-like [Saccoglossus kowalevskii]
MLRLNISQLIAINWCSLCGIVTSSYSKTKPTTRPSMESLQLLRLLCIFTILGIVNGAWDACSVTCGGGTQTKLCATPPCPIRSCMTIDCPLEIDYKHEGCWKQTTQVTLLEGGGNPYLDPTDEVRSCARAAYDEGYTYFVFLDGKCHAASTPDDYNGSGTSGRCRFGKGTLNKMDVYRIHDWECPTGSDYGFCRLPHIRTPISGRVCTHADDCFEVGGEPLDPVIICCKKVFCKDVCGQKIVHRNCWCDDKCIEHGDCCPEFMDDCSGKDTCSGVGDPHYTSFDNKYYHFQGKCEYTLLSTQCPLSPYDFQIIGINQPWGASAATTTKEVRLLFNDHNILLKQGKQIILNGVVVLPPVTVSPYTTITLAGSYLIVTTGYGIKIRWDGVYRVYVDVSSAHSGKVCGLCGNFNGNIGDEFIQPDGTQVTNVNVFGDSWAAAANCVPTKKRSIEEDLPPRGLAEDAKELCDSLFNSGNIPSCVNTVDPANYHFSCEMDVELSLPVVTGGCAVVADYVAQCINEGLTIGDWRTGTVCEVECPPGMAYTPCGPECPASCLDPYPIGSCTELCTEGCFCEEGLVLDEGGICIDKADCGCYYLGNLYRFGEVLPMMFPCCCNNPVSVYSRNIILEGLPQLPDNVNCDAPLTYGELSMGVK